MVDILFLFNLQKNNNIFYSNRKMGGVACCAATQIQDNPPLFTIIHFNDVYDIQPNKHGNFGAANFQALLRSVKNKFPQSLVLFSGDAFSPSLLSGIYRGRQMVKCLNKMQIDAACFGNHEFDLQPEETDALVKQCNFPWLLGNIRYKGTKETLGRGKPYIIKNIAGKKVGIFGVGGEDWLGILENYDGKLEYDDSVEFSRRVCKVLRNKQGCDFIIALTHLRECEDRKLASKVPQIDLVLGGHDHMKMIEIVGKVPVIKSGDDFESLGVIKVYQKSSVPSAEFKTQRFDFDAKILDVQPTQNLDPQLNWLINFCWEQYIRDDRLIGFTECEMEGRFEYFRCQETNLGNFWADITRAHYGCDAAIINSGCIRNDQIIDKGKLTYFTLSNIIKNSLVVLRLTGTTILQIVEQSLVDFPDAQSGSFLLISGISYKFSCKKQPKVQQILMNGQKLDLQKTYSVAMTEYLANGGDGYQVLESCQREIDVVHSIDMLTLINNFFTIKPSVGSNGWEEIDDLKKEKQNTKANSKHMAPSFISGLFSFANKQAQRAERMKNLTSGTCIGPDGKLYIKIAPKTDGRIICLDNLPEKANEMQSNILMGKNILPKIQKEKQSETPLTILHFSDAFDIQQETNKKKGIVNFEHFVNEQKKKYKNSLLLFSGGAFSSSKLSYIFEGYQMLNCLNSLHIDGACVSPYELQFNLEHSRELLQSCNFPWIIGNIYYKQSEKSVGKKYFIKEVGEHKIGIFGLGSEQLVKKIDPQSKNLIYQSWKKYAKQMAKQLKNKNSCTMVIALTYQIPDIESVAEVTTKIDLILAGNGNKSVHVAKKVPIVKSGKNFKSLSIINVHSKTKNIENCYAGSTYNYQINCVSVPTAKQGVNIKLKEYVDSCWTAYTNHTDAIGMTKVPLVITKHEYRTRQTNFGNLMADLVRAHFDADCAILEPEILNTDKLINAGKLKLSSFDDIESCEHYTRILPGKIIASLINLNADKSNILLVSGIKYTKSRNQSESIYINGEQLDLTKNYCVALPEVMTTLRLQMVDPYPIENSVSRGSDIHSLLLKVFSCQQSFNVATLEQTNFNKLRSIESRGKNGEILYSIAPLVEGRISLGEESSAYSVDQQTEINKQILPSIQPSKQPQQSISGKFSSSKSTPFSEQQNNRNSEDVKELINDEINGINDQLADRMIMEDKQLQENKGIEPVNPLAMFFPAPIKVQSKQDSLKQIENNLIIKKPAKRDSSNSLFGFDPISQKENNSRKNISGCFAPPN